MARLLGTLGFWLALFPFGAGGAFAADWSVVQLRGDVILQVAGARPASLGSGETLPAGGVLRTGPDSRAVLVRGEEQMIVGPNAVIAIPEESNDGFTTILQGAGVVEFTVEKRNVQHFSVQTPYLAAVVKGTRFVVGAFDASSIVKVARGRVEVTALASGQFVDVLTAQEVTVRSGGVLSLSGKGPLSPILQGTPPAPADAPGSPGATTAAPEGDGVGVDAAGILEVDASANGDSISVGSVTSVSIGSGGPDPDSLVDLAVSTDGLSLSIGDIDVDLGLFGR